MRTVLSSLAIALALVSTPAALAKGKAPAGMPKGLRALLANAAKTSVKGKAQPKAAPAECVNLAGSWKGSCTDGDGETYDDEFVIEQEDCTSMTFAGFGIDIGGAMQMNGIGEGFNYFMTMFPRWNPSRNVLRMHNNVSFMGGNDEWFVLGRGITEYSLLEGKLIGKSHSSSETVGGGGGTYEYWDECTYTK